MFVTSATFLTEQHYSRFIEILRNDVQRFPGSVGGFKTLFRKDKKVIVYQAWVTKEHAQCWVDHLIEFNFNLSDVCIRESGSAGIWLGHMVK